MTASIRILLAAIVALVSLSLHGSVNAQSSAWSSRGPAGAVPAAWNEEPAAAVAPTYPADRTIFAAADEWLVRSTDDGATWTYLEARLGAQHLTGLRQLWPAPGVDRNGIVLGHASAPVLGGASPGLHQSSDGGVTWRTVIPRSDGLPWYRNVSVAYSPAFAEDGIVFVVAQGRLHRSQDFGQTWVPIDTSALGASLAGEGVSAGGQFVQQMQLSPTFAQDRTAYVTLGTATYLPFPVSEWPGTFPHSSPVRPTTHFETSAGIAVSRDAGLSWHLTSSGLAVDGVPHRFVRQLTISPTFAQDQTIFAWAWGPPSPVRWENRDRLTFANALFRSANGGGSWEPVWVNPQPVLDIGWGYNQKLGLALSPTFAADRTIVATTAQIGAADDLLSDRRAWYEACGIWRSRDGGTSFEPVQTLPPDEARTQPLACGEPRFVGRDLSRLLVGGGATGGRIVESRDVGETWLRLGRPPMAEGSPLILGIADDGAILVRGPRNDGLFVHGGGARPEPTAPRCEFEIDTALLGEIGATYAKSRKFGCGVAPAATVQIRERIVGGARGLWVEDDSPNWWLLRADMSHWPLYETYDKAADPWSGPPSHVVSGAVQRLWAGDLLRLTLPDGTARGYAIGPRNWETVPAK